MSVIRVNKSKDYTVMSNHHLRDKQLSLKAKGLLSQMLSLPDDWDYSIDGLCCINKENVTAIKSTLKELKDCGYLVVTKLFPNQTGSGRLEYIYDIFEKPQEVKKQGVENLPLEIQHVENQPQLNTNKQSKDNKVKKHIYGENKQVRLTDEEYQKLQTEYGNADELIKYLDEAKAMKGYVYKSDYLAIRKWVVDAVKKAKTGGSRGWKRREDKLPEWYNPNPERAQATEKASQEEVEAFRELLKKKRMEA